jgi:hypothetical protein
LLLYYIDQKSYNRFRSACDSQHSSSCVDFRRSALTFLRTVKTRGNSNVLNKKGHKLGSHPMQGEKLNLGGHQDSPLNHKLTSSRALPVRPTCSQPAARCQQGCFKLASHIGHTRPSYNKHLSRRTHGRRLREVAVRSVSGQVKPPLFPYNRSSSYKRWHCDGGDQTMRFKFPHVNSACKVPASRLQVFLSSAWEQNIDEDIADNGLPPGSLSQLSLPKSFRWLTIQLRVQGVAWGLHLTPGFYV